MKIHLYAFRKLIVILLCVIGFDHAMAESRWSYDMTPPSKTILKKYLSTLDTENNITIDLKFYESMPTINRFFYGADFAFDEVLPLRSHMNRLNFGHLRVGGSGMDRYGFDTGMMLKYPYIKETGPNEFPTLKHDFEKLPPLRFANGYIRQNGAEPMFQVNITGFMPKRLPNGSVRVVAVEPAVEAARFVKFINGEQNLNVRFFTIGNEPLQWKSRHSDFIDQRLSADAYIDRFVDVVIAMREAQSEISGNPNDIQIIGPEVSQSWNGYNTYANEDCSGLETQTPQCNYSDGGPDFDNFLSYFLYRLGKIEPDLQRNPRGFKLLDVFSIHTYPIFRTDYHDTKSFVNGGKSLESVSTYLRSIAIYNSDVVNEVNYSFLRGKSINLINWIKTIVGKYYPSADFAITEFAVDSKVYIDYHPVVRPLMNSEMVAMAATGGALFTSKFLLNGDIFNPNTSALISEGNRQVPTTHAYTLMTANFVGKVLKVVVDGKNERSDLASYATFDHDRKQIVVLVFNRSTEELCAALDLLNVKDASEGKPLMITKACFPELSMTVMNIPTQKSNHSITVKTYGNRQLNTQRL